MADNGGVIVKKAGRQPHRKSRKGCYNCKRRKVKCDEVKPQCANCIRFFTLCHYPGSELREAATVLTTKPRLSSVPETTEAPRRGRGRPRKDWTTSPPQLLLDGNPSAGGQVGTSESVSPKNPLPTDLEGITGAELMHHYTLITAPKVFGSDDPHDPMTIFGTYNIPKISFQHAFLLRLIFALTAYHLTSTAPDESSRERFRALAERHLAAGLSGLNTCLRSLDDQNCGAAYAAALFVCYCTFAAGPTGPNDLLIINDGQDSTRWVSLVHGVRYLRESFDAEVLFSGYMGPMKPGPPASHQNTLEPTMIREKYAHIEWEMPLEALQDFLRGQDHADAEICSTPVKGLVSTFEAIFGRGTNRYHSDSANEFIFGWLYRMPLNYVDCLRRKSPLALIVLTYYTVLLRLLEKHWYMAGWSNHILTRATELLGSEYLAWTLWPHEQAKSALLSDSASLLS
ncbi:hypothetical protein BX600DRAFT_429577 [Xylariales sp. PMI_506]|nr:hypothetical protein BX600DRAFT_429577 [Xylariales sp. PMI_506]